MIVAVQIINKIITNNDLSLIHNYGLTREHFAGYEEAFDFIVTFSKNYKKAPDKETFIDKFSNWEYFVCTENDRALINDIQEQLLFQTTVKELKTCSSLLEGNANEAVTYLRSKINSLVPQNIINYEDITKTADKRIEAWKDKSNKLDKYFIPSGFHHLDKHTYGWMKGEELVVILARSGRGKSSVLIKTSTFAWEQGANVGFISPEMTASLVGYRFDNALKGFSSRSLFLGKDIEGYNDDYVNELKSRDNKYLVATPDDFGGRVTPSKLRNFCIVNSLDMLCVDGISYLQDDNYRKGDTPSITYANISQDLLQISIDLGIPVIVVSQSNRDVKSKDGEEETATLGNISDSDGIGRKATRVISIRHIGSGIELALIKNRYGRDNQKIIYKWNADTSEFVYIPQLDDEVITPTVKQEQMGAIF